MGFICFLDFREGKHVDLMDYMLNGVIHEFRQDFKFNFIDVWSISSPVLDEFGGGFLQFCFCISFRVICILLQQLMNLEDSSGSEREFALDLWAIVICFPPIEADAVLEAL